VGFVGAPRCRQSARARPSYPDSVVTDWSVDPEECGYFLSRVFDEWRTKDLGKVLVNRPPSQITVLSEGAVAQNPAQHL